MPTSKPTPTARVAPYSGGVGRSVVNRRLLLEFGADVNAKTEKRATPLLVATANGHLDVVVELIERGAELNCTDRSGDTALHHAAYHGSAALVQALVEAGADPTVIDRHGDTAYALGKRIGGLDAETIKLLQA